MIDIHDLQTACAASKEDSAELALAYNGRTAAMRAYNDRPGKQTRDDYTAAREMLEEVSARLQGKYFPEDQPAPEGERFANRKQALNWLQAQGYKVGQDKFYKDCKAGFPQIHRDKTISRFQVLQYAQQLDVDRRSSPLTDLSAQREDAETRKAIADAQKAEIQAAQLQRELDKNWISRTDSDLEVCTWSALVRDSLAHRISQSLPALIHATGGQIERLADGQAIIDQAITDGCNDIANSGDVDIEIEDMEDAI